MGWALPKGNCGGERDPAPWKVTYTGERSNEPEESPDAEKSVAVSKLEYGKTHQEPNGPSELRAKSPKIETPGWGLGTETLPLKVSPREEAGGRLGGGWVPRPWLQRLVPGLGGGAERKLLGRSLNHLKGQRLPGRLENKAVAEEGSNTLRAGKWKAASEGTWEKSLVCTRAGEGREEGVGPHRIPPTPQQAYRSAS